MDDTPSYARTCLDALKKWLTDDVVCASVHRGPAPCLRISACQDAHCGLLQESQPPK